MDILSRVRELLSNRKRSHPNRVYDIDDATIDGNIAKKIRMSLNSGEYNNNTNRMADTTRYSQPNSLNHHNRLYNGVSDKHNSYESASARQPVVNGEYPSVPNLLPRRSLFNKLQHRSFQPQQTVEPLYRFGAPSELDKFNRLPGLCPLNVTQRRPYNDGYQFQSSTYQPNHCNDRSVRVLDTPSFKKPEVGNLFRKPPTIPQSISQMFSKNSMPRSTKSNPTNLDRNSYQALLDKLMPSQFLKKPSKIFNNVTKTGEEVVDITNEVDDSSTISSNRSKFNYEPVNTLKARFESSPIYNKTWVTDLNKQYSETSLRRQQKIHSESERSVIAEQKTRETEDKYLETFQKISLDSYGLDVEEEEEPANDFPTLDEDKVQKVYQWVSGRDTATVLNSKFNINVSRHDIQTLTWSPLQWLNDEVINFYMELLAERGRTNEKLPKVHAMNTFFLKRLQEAGHGGVRRWTRKVDIFAFDIIPVPVHKGIHWCMAIIHLKNKTIKYYDSMGAPNNHALNALAEYLKEESLDKKKAELDMSDWTLENVQGIPQQENGSDCGVFSCMYAEFICRSRPIAFTQQNMNYFRMKMIYEICTGRMLN